MLKLVTAEIKYNLGKILLIVALLSLFHALFKYSDIGLNPDFSSGLTSGFVFAVSLWVTGPIWQESRKQLHTKLRLKPRDIAQSHVIYLFIFQTSLCLFLSALSWVISPEYFYSQQPLLLMNAVINLVVSSAILMHYKSPVDSILNNKIATIVVCLGIFGTAFIIILLLNELLANSTAKQYAMAIVLFVFWSTMVFFYVRSYTNEVAQGS